MTAFCVIVERTQGQESKPKISDRISIWKNFAQSHYLTYFSWFYSNFVIKHVCIFLLRSSALGLRTFILSLFSVLSWCTLYGNVRLYVQATSVCTDSNESHLMQKPTFISILAFQHYCSLPVFQCSAVVHTIVFNFVLQKSVHYLFQIYVVCLSLPISLLTLLHHSHFV